MRGDLRAAGVEAEDEPALERPGHLAEPVEVADGLGADDDPRDTHVEQLLDRGLIAQTAADLDLQQAQRGDGGNRLGVDRPAGLGTIEVDDVQPRGAVGGEFLRLLDGVVLVGDLSVVLALDQPDHLAVPQVNRRNHVHLSAPCIPGPAPHDQGLCFSGRGIIVLSADLSNRRPARPRFMLAVSAN